MDRVRVSISGDAMGATIAIVPGSAATADALQRAIADAGVVHGMLHDVIADLGRRLADPAFAAQCEIARGVPVQPCRDGRIERRSRNSDGEAHDRYGQRLVPI